MSTTQEKADIALDALQAIAVVVGGSTGATALQVIAVVQAIIAAASQGFEGTLDANAVRDELTRLTQNIEQNDENADEALRKKFAYDADPEMT